MLSLSKHIQKITRRNECYGALLAIKVRWVARSWICAGWDEGNEDFSVPFISLHRKCCCDENLFYQYIQNYWKEHHCNHSILSSFFSSINHRPPRQGWLPSQGAGSPVFCTLILTAMPGVSLPLSSNSRALHQMYKQTASELPLFLASWSALPHQASPEGATACWCVGLALTYSATGCHSLGYSFSALLPQVFFLFSFEDVGWD